MNSKLLLEMLEACRPGHDDLAQPELQSLADELTRNERLQAALARSQRHDTEIARAMHDVTTPAGLLDRLLATLEAETGLDVDHAETDEVNSAPLVLTSEPSPAARERRPWVLGGSIALSLAALSLAAAWLIMAFGPHRMERYQFQSEPAVAEYADQWDRQLQGAAWQTVSLAPTKAFPLGTRFGDNIVAWQWVAKNQIVCYELSGEPERVRLYVMQPRQPVTLASTPPEGYHSAEGWHVGAWQANGLIYVLAVKADGSSKDLYRRVVGPALLAA